MLEELDKRRAFLGRQGPELLSQRKNRLDRFQPLQSKMPPAASNRMFKEILYSLWTIALVHTEFNVVGEGLLIPGDQLLKYSCRGNAR